MTILGPLPCKACRSLVAFADVGVDRMIVSVDTGRAHACEPVPVDWSWSDLVRRYGEEGALTRLADISDANDRRRERERARKREYQRRRRAAVA